MTTDEVFAELLARGADRTQLAQLPLRRQPADGQPHPGDRVFYLSGPPLALPDGRYLAVSWSFGAPDADELKNWLVRWHDVHGPMTRAELEALARE